VKGFKCFLIESVVEEFPCVSENDLTLAMDELQDTSSALLFHAELDDGGHNSNTETTGPPDRTCYATFLDSRPPKLETDAISLVIRLQKKFPNLRCHIVHLSASSALPLIREAKSAGLKLTAETCFHYLCLTAQMIPSGRPEFKCCPPIRDSLNRDLLWDALREGTIDCVVSDHSPCVAELKNLDKGDFMSAWGGISTLGLGLSLLWTEGRKRGISIRQMIDWTSTRSAAHAGLSDIKGQLKAGFDGDFILWNPNATFKVTKESLNFKNKLSPYEGTILDGSIEQTYLRGTLIYDRNIGFENILPTGKLL